MNSKESILKEFGRLLDIMDTLREKCPWDQKQTFQTLKNLTIEEVYELTDAIQENNIEELKKEIGDVLLHLVFYAKIASETQSFDMGDVLHSICEKLIYRHPHIYENLQLKDEEEVKKNWEILKLKEGRKSVLEGIPKALPAMNKAFRIQDKVKGVGFEFENPTQVLDKIREELQEFETETDISKKEMEFGDLLFSLINYARFVGIQPEDALERSNKKFIQRFQDLEKLSLKRNKMLQNLSITELNELWGEVKRKEN